jgi:hypothetical protein
LILSVSADPTIYLARDRTATVTRDRSLSEFDDADDSETAPESDTDEPSTAGLRSTYAWTTEPVECEDCSTTVQRRWTQNGALVCADCKDWTD